MDVDIDGLEDQHCTTEFVRQAKNLKQKIDKSFLNQFMDPVTEFEKRIAAFFGAPYGVAVDSCTHGLELCLRHLYSKSIICPNRTYLSVPMLARKLGIELHWLDFNWQDYYYLSDKIIDAAVLWRPNSYIPFTYMVISFQHQKHLSLGRGGMILTNNKASAEQLKRLSYDGREPGIPWREQNIYSEGYHYYMIPEIAEKGLIKLDEAIRTPPRKWVIEDWPDLTQMEIFKP